MLLKNWLRILPITLCYSVAGVFPANAEDKNTTPKLEFGMGIGVASVPHYRGSDQSKIYAAPIPFIRYYGKRLKVDREGGRFYFYKKGKFRLDLSTAFAFPLDSDDNTARKGMQDLDWVIELGPRAQFYLYESPNSNLRFRVGLPLRPAFTSGGEAIGWVFSPYFQVRYYTGVETALSIGPMWATEKYNDYYYEVDQRYATANRPAYNARGGYSGARLTFTLSKRFNDYWFGMFARYDTLNGAIFEDSPLVKQKDSFMVGLLFSYVFKSSSEKVVRD